MLKHDKGATDQSQLPKSHNHFHADESYCLSRLNFRLIKPGVDRTTYIGVPDLLLSDGIYGHPDHPPQKG